MDIELYFNHNATYPNIIKKLPMIEISFKHVRLLLIKIFAEIAIDKQLNYCFITKNILTEPHQKKTVISLLPANRPDL